MWLASGSLWYWKKGAEQPDCVLTGRMTGHQRVLVTDALHELLEGIGMPEHERCFRMNLSVCIHRRLSDVEKVALPKQWCDIPAIHLAGGPVELLWAKGLQDKPSVRPCKNPTKLWLRDLYPDNPGPDTWLPQDCGRCEPCRARSAIVESVRRQYPEYAAQMARPR